MSSQRPLLGPGVTVLLDEEVTGEGPETPNPDVGSLVGLEVGVNRPIKINTQTFIKFIPRHCRSGGRHCRTAALPGQKSGTAVPADNFEPVQNL